MTVPNTTPLSGPYTADGVNRLWDFGYKITAASDMNIIVADDAAGTNAVIYTTGFDFPSSSSIGSSTGGTVRFPIAPTAAIQGGKIIRTIRAPSYAQPDAIGNQGDFYPETVEGALDRLTMQTQDLLARFARVPIAPVGSTGNDLIASIGASAVALASASAAGASASQAAAAISASSALTAKTAAEAALASTLAAYDSFDDRYLGAKAVAPTLDNDGNALAAGSLYFDTVAAAMKIYTGTVWVAAYVSGTGFAATASNLSDLASATAALTNLGLSANGKSLVTAASYAAMKVLLSLDVVDNTSDATKNSATATLTNKRITPRIGTEASSATSTPTADTVDQWNVTALAAADAFAAPTGTPTHGQKLLIRIKDNGTARALTWNAIYRSVGGTLPTTTVINKTLYVGLVYNATDSKWDCIATAQEA